MVIALTLLALWLAGHAALRREGRQPPGELTPLVAVFGRICTLPAGTEVLTAKKWHFSTYDLPEPIRVWVGWWNCRRFNAGSERYYFIERRSRFAVPVVATLSARELVS